MIFYIEIDISKNKKAGLESLKALTTLNRLFFTTPAYPVALERHSAGPTIDIFNDSLIFEFIKGLGFIRAMVH